MDQRLNPYTPGSGVKPLKLAGRDEELDSFRVLLERLADGRPERSLIYSGLRGVGKTVLLLEFETLAASAAGSATTSRRSAPETSARLLPSSPTSCCSR